MPDQSVKESNRFVLFAAGQGVSATGMWMQKAAIGWLAWELTGSAAWVGALALTELAAALLVAPFAGAMIDRANSFRLIWTTQILMICVSAALFGLLQAGVLTISLLLVMALADSFVQAFNQPVRLTIIGFLAGPARLGQAIATNSLAFNAARAIGPAIAGLIMLHGGGTTNVFIACAISFLAMMPVLLRLKPFIDRPVEARGGNIFAEIGAGYRYVAQTPPVATIILLAVVFSLLARPFTELFPAIAGDIFDGGPDTLAALMSAQGVGALVGGSLMLRRHSVATLVRFTFGAGFGLSLVLVVFATVDWVPLAVLLMVAAGMGHVMCNVGMQSLVQLLAQSAFRGRVVALYGLIFRAGPAASAGMIGLMTHWIPLQVLIGGAAAACCLAILAIGVISRRVFATKAT